MAGVGIGASLRRAGGRARWELRRAWRWSHRQLGTSGLVVLTCGLLVTAAWGMHRHAEQRLAAITARLAERTANPASRPVVQAVDDTAQAAAFLEVLVPHDQIPTVVADLIRLAEAEHLFLAKGDYQVQPEAQGGFMRYRMILPIKGDAQAIHRFMIAALKANMTLALESVQFKRDQVLSTTVDARIQWLLLTRMPEPRRRNAAGDRP